MDNRASPSGERSAENVRRRRRAQEVQLQATNAPPRIQMTHPTPSIDSRAPLPITRARAFATPATSHLQRHRLRRQREDEAFETVQDAVNRLNEVTSNLTSVLDEPLPHILGPDEFTGLIDDMDGYNRRSKRRKLDSDPLDAHPSFSYGYHGQVAPGRLKMVMSSCDGGQITEPDELHPHRYYPPENLLRNDKSVYCSKRDKCNIVLKHWGETPFTVTKVIIKAPDLGFNSPVQEGMVFVAMNQEHLISRTSAYQIQETCPHLLSRQGSQRAHPLHGDQYRPSINDRYYSQRIRHLSRRLSRPHVPGSNYLYPPVSGTDSPDTDSTPPPDDVYPFGYIRQANESTHRESQPPVPEEHVITTSCEDPSGDEEDSTSPEVLTDLQHRRLRADESSTSEEDEEQPRSLRYRRQRGEPRTIEWVDKGSESDSKTQSKETIPRAAFFIEKKKNVVSIKFNPPISGRYMLLKLWSPHPQGNIEIQSVQVHGFAGPRYFPAIAMA